ncbi:MAG TPA: hypothetical protein DHN29_21575 [Cytophagales bacterium]|nr:hypothetical protein [Cytophagales bacterium]
MVLIPSKTVLSNQLDIENFVKKQLAPFRERDWTNHIRPLNEAEKRYFDEHPMKDTAEGGCEECNSTGQEETTYNPKSKWDWYAIGGRWDGWLTDQSTRMKKEGSPGDENTEKEIGTIESLRDSFKSDHEEDSELKEFNWPDYDKMGQDILPNIRMVGELNLDTDDHGNHHIPFAIITPDGEWHEKGQMCWFACVSNENVDWDQEAVEILKKHKDHLAVAVDLHI